METPKVGKKTVAREGKKKIRLESAVRVLAELEQRKNSILPLYKATFEDYVTTCQMELDLLNRQKGIWTAKTSLIGHMLPLIQERHNLFAALRETVQPAEIFLNYMLGLDEKINAMTYIVQIFCCEAEESHKKEKSIKRKKQFLCSAVDLLVETRKQITEQARILRRSLAAYAKKDYKPVIKVRLSECKNLRNQAKKLKERRKKCEAEREISAEIMAHIPYQICDLRRVRNSAGQILNNHIVEVLQAEYESHYNKVRDLSEQIKRLANQHFHFQKFASTQERSLKNFVNLIMRRKRTAMQH